MRKRTIHEIPILLKPILWLYGIVGAIIIYTFDSIFKILCRIEYAGKENLDNSPNHIFSFWHENVPLFFIAHRRFEKPHIWLTYPMAYMKPTHILKKVIGANELAYGASGHNGKKSLEKVIIRLNEGWSTFINPDGPKGPLKELKKGVLLMSLKSSVPIIPVGFHLEKSWRLPSWDRKRYPPFFSKLTVVYGKPIIVTKENFELAKEQISSSMNDVQSPKVGDSIPPEI